jgi:hypothetical protein
LRLSIAERRHGLPILPRLPTTHSKPCRLTPLAQPRALPKALPTVESINERIPAVFDGNFLFGIPRRPDQLIFNSTKENTKIRLIIIAPFVLYF